MFERLSLFKDLSRMFWRHRFYFLLPMLLFILLGVFLLVVLESPALIPFFYAIF